MKNRLVGVLVLLLIAYIGSPIIFGTDEIVPVDITPQVEKFEVADLEYEQEAPTRDLFEEKNIQEAQADLLDNEKPEPLSLEKRQAIQYPVETISEVKGKTSRGDLDGDGVPISWTLQLASFEENVRAQKLLKQLQAKGFKSYTKSVNTSKGPRVRVYAGPSLDKVELASIQKKIDQAFKLKSLMLRFTPDA